MSPVTDDVAARVRAEIAEEMKRAMRTFVSKDWRLLSSKFCNDASWILPDGQVFHGREAIAACAKSLYEGYDRAEVGEFRIDKVIVVSEREAVVFATMTFALHYPDRPVDFHRDPAANHWRKEDDGQWRIAYELNAYGGPVTDLSLN